MGEKEPVKEVAQGIEECPEKAGTVDKSDWKHLAFLADQILPRGNNHRVISMVSLGMYILSIIGLFPLYNMTLRTGSWILHTAWFCLTISMILGIVTIVMDARKESEMQVAVETLIKEMKAVEKGEERPEI